MFDFNKKSNQKLNFYNDPMVTILAFYSKHFCYKSAYS